MSLATNMGSQNSKERADVLLQKLFRRLFQVEEIAATDSMETIPLWDSMGHMELMAALEQTFGIRIDHQDIIQLTSINSIRKYLEGKI